jgi:diacylglycerol kinase (ATP)
VPPQRARGSVSAYVSRGVIRVMDSAVKKTVVVANPQSASGALGRRWPEISRALRRALPGHEAVLTRGPRDATGLAREALRAGADLVVAVGGDGTIHEVVNGFFEGGRPIRPGAALGVLPFGTGGDFRKTARIPRELDRAIAILARGVRRQIDVGHLEYRQGTHAGPEASCVFINIASFGISGLVDRIVNGSSKRLGGRVTFFLATARAALRYRNQRIRLVVHGREGSPTRSHALTINSVSVANGRFFGGGMMIAPRAELDDGVFEVVSIGDASPIDLVRNGRRVYDGTHLGLPYVSAWRAARIEAHPAEPGADVLLDVDGEALGALPATFSVLPRALSLVVAHG